MPPSRRRSPRTRPSSAIPSPRQFPAGPGDAPVDGDRPDARDGRPRRPCGSQDDPDDGVPILHVTHAEAQARGRRGGRRRRVARSGPARAAAARRRRPSSSASTRARRRARRRRGRRAGRLHVPPARLLRARPRAPRLQPHAAENRPRRGHRSRGSTLEEDLTRGGFCQAVDRSDQEVAAARATGSAASSSTAARGRPGAGPAPAAGRPPDRPRSPKQPREVAPPTGPVTVESGVSMRDFSQALGIPMPQIIKMLMDMGSMKTATQTLTDDEVELIAAELGARGHDQARGRRRGRARSRSTTPTRR